MTMKLLGFFTLLGLIIFGVLIALVLFFQAASERFQHGSNYIGVPINYETRTQIGECQFVSPREPNFRSNSGDQLPSVESVPKDRLSPSPIPNQVRIA